MKHKGRILKAARERKELPIKEFSLDHQLISQKKKILQARRGWKEVFKVMRSKDLQPGLLYPAKLPFRMEGQIKCFPDKIKLKEFIFTKPIYEMLKGLI